MMTKMLAALALGVLLAATPWCAAQAAPEAVVPLHVDGANFVDAAGHPVRFWGMNIAALYPSHTVADKVAANLAACEVNLVRPHHMLRSSSDWVTKAPGIVALQDYASGTTRKPNPEAWDRFDYFNAALGKHGIYLDLAVWWTRRYLPGDVDVLKTNDADRQAWMNAIDELNGWNWKKAFDPRKMLAVIDDRAAALNVEFAKQLLTHVNPYTKVDYAHDPQVLTLELLNETATNYIILCGNKLPEYFQKELLAKWDAYAKQAGIEPGDLYKPANAQAVEVRAHFLEKLDRDFLDRMKKVVEATGCTAPVAFSNLWQGDTSQEMYARNNGYIEDHCYFDPRVVNERKDFIYALSHTPIVGKPFLVGEMNMGQSAKDATTQGPERTMMPLAVAAYGSLQNWAGVDYFAWMHGDKMLADNGWSTDEGRGPNLGYMISDGMMIDQLRTCGMIFRRGLVERSTQPITLHVDEPLATKDYNTLMRGKYAVMPGWQDIHEVRKTYGPVPAGQASAAWMTETPKSPLVSDTGQIVKDMERKQLTLAAPLAEAFSGQLDGRAPAGLKHLAVSGDGFATVVAVADDAPASGLAASGHLVISRTNVGKDGKELDGPQVRLTGMNAPAAGQAWYVCVTRPRDGAATGQWKKLESAAGGEVTLPAEGWHECELELRNK